MTNTGMACIIFLMPNAIKKVIQIIGSQTALARKCGVRQQSVGEWVEKGKIPPRRVLKVWRLVKGKVPLWELNSDIYDREFK